MSQKEKIKQSFVELIQETQRKLDVCSTTGTIDWANFEFWRSACQDAIELTFGPNTRNLTEFQNIRFSVEPALSSLALITHKIGLIMAKEKLMAMLYTVKTWLPEDKPLLPPAPIQPVIFISHGKISRRQLGKLKEFLTTLGATAIIVEDEANSGMTPAQKVENYMANCNVGLVLMTADDKMKESDEVRGRPNVDNEIGMLRKSDNINKRIIIFKEATVILPSNYSELVRENFNRSQIETIFTRIVKELKAWGFFN